MIEIPFNKKYTQFQDRNVLPFTGIATPETEKISFFFKNTTANRLCTASFSAEQSPRPDQNNVRSPVLLPASK